VLILDEPTSMLDPVSRKRIFDVLAKLKQDQQMTIVVIEHSLENLVPLSDRMVLLSNGQLLLHDETRAFFQNMDLLLEHGIYPPGIMQFFHRLNTAGFSQGELPLTVDEAAARMEQLLSRLRATPAAPQGGLES
jgi:ABC-type multidrug transport system ATPase subunit